MVDWAVGMAMITKRTMIVYAFIPVVVALVLTLLISDEFWTSLLSGIISSFLALGVGMVFVNLYLERSERKVAIKALRSMVLGPITCFHNDFYQLAWDVFGQTDWDKIVQEYQGTREYQGSPGKPAALKKQNRDSIYSLFANNTALRDRCSSLDGALTDLAYLSGWNLHTGVLQNCLDARTALRELNAINLDGSPNAIDKVTESILDADAYADEVLRLVNSIVGES